ncbi:Gfo/Idh/MocA family protein [Luteitalea sp.]
MATDHTPGMSRRDFIITTAGTTAGAVATSIVSAKPASALPQTAKSAGRVLGANDRINFAVVGVKGMGGGHLRNLSGEMTQNDNVQVVAICDVWSKARATAIKNANLTEAQAFAHYDKMLSAVGKDIDAVVVATPDHWHAALTIASLQAGKHVYVEKPMTHTLDEAFKIQGVAKSTGKLVQVGSQGCSDPKWLKARELVKAGKLGTVLWAQGSYCRNNPKGEWNYEIDPEGTPETIDWQTWLGPAPKRPFSAERYFRWRKYWDYGNGIIGDLWPHRLHPLMLAMDIDEYPARVACMGSDMVHTDKGPGPDGKPWGEPRDVADTTLVMVEFPSGKMIFLAGSTTNERGIDDVIRGNKANLLAGGTKLMLQPERPYVDEIEASDETPEGSGESHLKHMRNFVESMRANTQPNCDVELGCKVQTIVSMAETAYRQKRQVTFDETKKRLT